MINLDFLAGPGHGPGVIGPVYLEALIRKSIQTRARTRKDCGGSSNSSPSRAASEATALPKRPDPFTKGAN
jgi:hypothetical protein